MDWEPAHADHSIDRAVVTASWLNPIDANTFDELVVAGRKAAAAHHLTDRVDLQEVLEVPPGGGALIDLNSFTALRRVAFRRLDQTRASVEEVSIGMQRIVFLTQRYRRWVNFRQLIEEIMGSLERVCPITQNVKSVRLEYLDRFQSKPGGADHFEVIAKASQYIPPVLLDKSGALHAHSGWFDHEPANMRRLTNVNIDVNDLSVPLPDNRRSLTLLTLGQFETLHGSIPEPIAKMDVLHDYLKKIFEAIITAEAAARVSLNE